LVIAFTATPVNEQPFAQIYYITRKKILSTQNR